MAIQREQLEADVLIVGAGPAGLSCALHLANLIKEHNASGAQPELSAENIYVLEKGRDIGAHQLSGAIMNPKALAELIPDFEKSAPLDTPVTDSAALIFTEKSAIRIPVTPPPFNNTGNYVVSLNKLAKWMGGLVEAAGVNVFKEFGGAELIYDGEGIAGVITEDKGLDKDRQAKGEFHSRATNCARKLRFWRKERADRSRSSWSSKKHLDNLNPQSLRDWYQGIVGCAAGQDEARICGAHTGLAHLHSNMYGGGWIYGLSNNRVSIGLVIALEYEDPRFDPHAAFQTWKTHPYLREILDGGKLVRYGAKSLPYGGWYAMPQNYVDGGLIVGDSGSFLDSQRLKGIHLAIKSGMLAAETIFVSLKKEEYSANTLKLYKEKIDQSYIKEELWKVRNFHQSFRTGMLSGLFHAGLQQLTGGRGLIDPMRVHPGHEAYGKIHDGPAPGRFKGDGKLTFDRLTDVYHSGTRHDDDQPCHLKVHDLSICAMRCVEEYGNPCQYFCPAAVYEMVKEGTDQKLKINAANCVHCKTCDIADPYQIIDWVVPEGGGGPNYEGM